MIKEFLRIVFSIGVTWSVTFVALAQDEPIRMATDLVEVPVMVLDRNGRYISNLTQSSFKIYENGAEQEIAIWKAINNPVSVLFLVDVSGSMESHSGRVLTGVDRFVGQLRDHDRVAIATFDADSRIDLKSDFVVKSRFAVPRSLITKTAHPYSRGEQRFTTTFDAIEEAIKFVKTIEGRKAIVYFGDGELFGHKASIKSNFSSASESEAAIYAVQYGEFPSACLIPDPFWSGRTSSITGERSEIVTNDDLKNLGSDCRVYQRDKKRLVRKVDEYMTGLADRSGGRAFKVPEISDLDTTFKRILDELSQQYFLAYYPKSQSKSERRVISVKVDVAGAVVRARREVVLKK